MLPASFRPAEQLDCGHDLDHFGGLSLGGNQGGQQQLKSILWIGHGRAIVAVNPSLRHCLAMFVYEGTS